MVVLMQYNKTSRHEMPGDRAPLAGGLFRLHRAHPS